MTRSGTPAARATTGQTLQPSRPQTKESATAGVPETVVPPPAIVPFVAFGLRKTPAGYEVVQVKVAGESIEVLVLGQPEPQRAIAYRYLEQHVERDYFQGQV